MAKYQSIQLQYGKKCVLVPLKYPVLAFVCGQLLTWIIDNQLTFDIQILTLTLQLTFDIQTLTLTLQIYCLSVVLQFACWRVTVKTFV